MKHQRPPMETRHRQAVVDSWDILDAPLDAATEERIRRTTAYVLATFRDTLGDLAESVKQAYRDGRRSGRRPW